jgi:hypothetical protein
MTDWVSKGLTSLGGSSFKRAEIRMPPPVRTGTLGVDAELGVGGGRLDVCGGLGGKTAMRGSEQRSGTTADPGKVGYDCVW